MLRKLAVVFVFLLIILILLSYIGSSIFSNYNEDSRFFQRIGEEIVRPLLLGGVRNYVSSSNLAASVAREVFPYIELDMVDSRQGSGPRVFCGQSVKAMMYGYTENPRQVFLQRRNGIFISRVGDRSISKAIDLTMLGMQIGGERIVSIPKTMPVNSNFIKTFRPKKREMIFEIGLLEVLDYQEFDPRDLLISRSSQGMNKTITCGDRVSFDVTIRKLCAASNESIVFESKAHEAIIGKFQTPMAIELGLEGSMLGSRVTVLAPAKFLVTKDSEGKGGSNSYLGRTLNDCDLFLITIWPRDIVADAEVEDLSAFEES